MNLVNLAALLVLLGATACAPARVKLDPAEFPTRDDGGLRASCDQLTFIVSLNDDDDDLNGKDDLTQNALPRQENNLREIDFPPVDAADKVYIGRPVFVQGGETALGKRVRGWTANRAPFQFNQLHSVPMLLLMEGIEVSPDRNDFGFEFQYKKDDQWLCGGGALGTVVDVNASLDVQKGGEANDLQEDGHTRLRVSGNGTPFKKYKKMLVRGTGLTGGSVHPQMPTLWSYDGDGSFLDPVSPTTTFTAGDRHTARNLIDQHDIQLRVEDGGQRIEAHFPVNLTAPLHLSTRSRNVGIIIPNRSWLDANRGTFTPLPRKIIKYRILDQQRQSIQRSAYGGVLPQIRENIGNVLTSPIPRVQDFIDDDLKWTPNWKSKPDGDFRDRIHLWNMDKDHVTVSPVPGRRVFHDILRNDVPGNPDSGVLMHVSPPSSHIWFLGVDEHQTAEGTSNEFSSVVVDRKLTSGDIQIRLRTRYTIHVQ